MVKNKYLEKIAVTRLVKEIAKGNVKAKASELASKGFLRPADTYAEGIERGSKALLDKAKLKVTYHQPKTNAEKLIGLTTGGYSAHHNNSSSFVNALFGRPDNLIQHHLPESKLGKFLSPLHSVKHTPEQSRLVDAFAKRHETNEIIEMNKQLSTRSQANRVIADKPPISGLFVDKKGNPVGNHASQNVLLKENNDYVKNPHSREALDKFKELRDRGETSILTRMTGKDAYSSHVYKKKDFNKADWVHPNIKINGQHAHANMTPDEIASFNKKQEFVSHAKKSLLDFKKKIEGSK